MLCLGPLYSSVQWQWSLSSHLYTSCLFSMPLNDDIVDIEESDEYVDLFLLQMIF